MGLKFIHAADLHLDSPLAGLSRVEGGADATDAAALIRSASRRALAALVDRALAEKVAFVLFAGDLWDGACVDVGTGLFFQQQMRRLRSAGIGAYAILGNHDAESQITRIDSLFESLFLFGKACAETVRPDGLPVALHGRSFPEPAVKENLAAGYPDPVPGVLNVALLHTGLEGREGHGRYAPCTVADLRGKGYDYWALGHIHAREVVAESRAPGDGGTIAWSGVLQGRHVRETGGCGAFLVELGEGPPRLVPLDLDLVRWAVVGLDLTGAEALDEAATMLGAKARLAFDTLTRTAGGRLLAVRVVVRGATILHGAIDLTRGFVRERVLYAADAAGVDQVFVETVRLDTSPPPRPAATGDGGSLDALAGLLATAAADAALAGEIADDMRKVVRDLPEEVRRMLGELEPDLMAALDGDAPALAARAAARARAGLTLGAEA